MVLNFTFNNFRKSQCQTTGRKTCVKNGAIHEFGHALGISHEQNRDDTPATCNEPESGTNGDTKVGNYDAMSIMNYCHPQRSSNYGGKFFNLSQGDISTVNQMYNRKVGVIPEKNTNCPLGSELVTIHMDDEDSRNANEKSGWIGAIESSNNTTFKFCKVSGEIFKPLNTKEAYALLKLGVDCPNGSKTLIRKFDNEDSKNRNYMSSNAYPNVNNGNTYMHFCFFDSTNRNSTMSSFPKIGIKYRLFAGSGFSKALNSGYIHTDDEDYKNVNYFSGNNTESSKIISGTRNTDINIRRVQSIRSVKQIESYIEAEFNEEIVVDDIVDKNDSIKYISIVKVK